MYKIIGGDGNEYGPVSAETMRQWLAENRVNGQTKVRTESGEWQTLADFPELMPGMAQPPLPGGAPPPFAAAPQRSAEPYEGDYQLDLGGCIARGWELLKLNFGVLFGGFMIYIGVQFVVGVLSAIPLIGTLFTLASWVAAGPFMGGLFFLSLRVIRGEAAQPFDVFEGFRRSFGQLFLTQLVSGLIALACLLPTLVTAGVLLLPMILSNKLAEPPVPQLIIIGAVFVVSLPALIFVSVNWMFALPLVLDRDMDFWSAMKLSWRRVRLHWWSCFGLTVLVALLNVAGVLACCLGWLITMPIGLAATMYAYETIFSGDKTPTA